MATDAGQDLQKLEESIININHLKQELKERLIQVNEQDTEYKIPEFFTKCHAKQSIKLIVEGREIHASKQILRLASPVFKSMFDSDFSEKDKTSIELPGKTCHGIVLLLNCIYPNILDQIEADRERRKPVIDRNTLSEKAQTAMDSLGNKLCIQVVSYFGTAEDLRRFFGKLNVMFISLNSRTGQGNVVFEDHISALCAYCLDGENFRGETMHIIISKTDFEADVSLLGDSTDGTHTWTHKSRQLSVLEKLSILLKLADEYQIESVLRLCEEKYMLMYHKELESELLLVDKLLELLQVADRYNMPNMLDRLCNQAARIPFEQMEDMNDFKTLSVKTRYKIVNAKYLHFVRVEKSYLCYEKIRRPLYQKRKYPQKYGLVDDISPFLTGNNAHMTLLLQIGSQRLFASKEVLALSSTYMEDMIKATSMDENTIVLEFPGENYEDFICLLRSIHPKFSSGTSVENVHRLLKLAHRFKIRKLADDCDKILDEEMDKELSVSERELKEEIRIVSENLRLAEQYKLSELQESCCKFLSTVEQDKVSKLQLSLDVKLTIMSKYISIVEKEKRLNPHLEYAYRDYIYDIAVKPDAAISEVTAKHRKEENTFRIPAENEVCLVINGLKLYADEDILSIASPVLMRMIHDQLQENGDCNVATLALESSEADFIVLLRCLYPNRAEKLNGNEAMTLLQFVDRYQMTALCKLIEVALIKHCQEGLPSTTIVDYITTAVTYQLPALLVCCKSALRKKYREPETTSGSDESLKEKTKLTSTITILEQSDDSVDYNLPDEFYADYDNYSVDDY